MDRSSCLCPPVWRTVCMHLGKLPTRHDLGLGARSWQRRRIWQACATFRASSRQASYLQGYPLPGRQSWSALSGRCASLQACHTSPRRFDACVVGMWTGFAAACCSLALLLGVPCVCRVFDAEQAEHDWLERNFVGTATTSVSVPSNHAMSIKTPWTCTALLRTCVYNHAF